MTRKPIQLLRWRIIREQVHNRKGVLLWKPAIIRKRKDDGGCSKSRFSIAVFRILTNTNNWCSTMDYHCLKCSPYVFLEDFGENSLCFKAFFPIFHEDARLLRWPNQLSSPIFHSYFIFIHKYGKVGHHTFVCRWTGHEYSESVREAVQRNECWQSGRWWHNSLKTLPSDVASNPKIRISTAYSSKDCVVKNHLAHDGVRTVYTRHSNLAKWATGFETSP